jgi:hypothetical protein
MVLLEQKATKETKSAEYSTFFVRCLAEKRSLPSVNFIFQLRFDQGAEGVVQAFVFDPAEHFLEEAEDEQFVGLFLADAAREEVKLLLGVEVAGGGAVGAADVVGLNLESGQGIGLGLVAEHEVAVALVGVGLLRVGFDDDQAREDRARLVESTFL